MSSSVGGWNKWRATKSSAHGYPLPLNSICSPIQIVGGMPELDPFIEQQPIGARLAKRHPHAAGVNHPSSPRSSVQIACGGVWPQTATDAFSSRNTGRRRSSSVSRVNT